MAHLPPPNTPLNQHSLIALESWLHQLGAQRSADDITCWHWAATEWSAEIRMEQDELIVAWKQNDKISQCSFSYGLPRSDVEAAMSEGP